MQTRRDPDPPSETELDRLVAATEGLQPWRRVAHASTGLALGLVPPLLQWDRTTTVIVLTSILVLQIALDVVRFRVEAIQKLFFTVLSRLASPREARGTSSSTWYTVSAIIVYGLFPTGIASSSILVLGLADPAAGTVGRLFGRRKFGTGSMEGSATFFVTAMLVLLIAVDWPVALAAALAATVIEVIPGIGDDNLIIPVVTGSVLWLLLSAPI